LSKRPSSAFLDSNVFIYGRLENCNSRLVILIAQLGEFDVIVSDLVVEEVERFFREEVSREAAYLGRRFVETLARKIVHRDDIAHELRELKGQIKDRDLENLATVRHARLKYLVSYDVDYRKAHVREYVTPKGFVKLFSLEPYLTDY
jgi:predicted nucleic acid-binding protein